MRVLSLSCCCSWAMMGEKRGGGRIGEWMETYKQLWFVVHDLMHHPDNKAALKQPPLRPIPGLVSRLNVRQTL
jgi:hypothetical protein